MMSEKRLYSYDKGNNKILCNLNDVCDFNVSNVFQLLNSLTDENEQLRKQIQNYKQLIANSYEGEEERLDGFFGKYVIWEDELQKMIK